MIGRSVAATKDPQEARRDTAPAANFIEVVLAPDRAAAALEYAAAGIPVLPVYPASPEGYCSCKRAYACASPAKHPHRMASCGVHSASVDPGKVSLWWRFNPELNVALAAGHPLPTGGHLAVLDIDPRNDGDASISLLEERFGSLPRTHTVRTGSGGWHHYYSTDHPVRSAVGLAPGVDLVAQNGYVLAPPSQNTRGPYILEDQAPIAPIPSWLLDILTSRTVSDSAGELEGGGLPAELDEMLAAIPPGCGYDEWVRVGMALHHADPDGGFRAWDQWSAGCPSKYRAYETRRKWKSFGRGSRGAPVTLGTLRRIAEDYGWTNPAVAHGAAVSAALLSSAQRIRR